MRTLYLERTTRYCPLEQLRRQRYADDVTGLLLWVQSSTKDPPPCRKVIANFVWLCEKKYYLCATLLYM